jgi:hypothetical protein
MILPSATLIPQYYALERHEGSLITAPQIGIERMIRGVSPIDFYKDLSMHNCVLVKVIKGCVSIVQQ